MKTKHYHVRLAGQSATFAHSDWSGYHNRFHAIATGEKRGLVYGLEQAKAHIKELRRHVWDGKKIHKNAVFEIVKSVTFETVVATIQH